MIWKPQPSGFSDYRPVALRSHVMKTLERLVLDQLRPIVRPHLDPLEFAYQLRSGAEDSIIYLLNRVYTHLDKPGSTVRVMFFDFSSAFNTIGPALLGDKLMAMLVDPPLCVLDCGLPHWLTTVCALAALCVRCSGQQHWGPTRDCPLSSPLHPLHHRLQLPDRVLPASEVS